MAYPALPFTLSGDAIIVGPQSSLLLARIELLQQIALATREDVALLRSASADILHILSTSASQRTAAHSASTPQGGGRTLSFRLFGTFEAFCSGVPIARWTSRKARLLLAYLAMHPRRRVPKEVLIELFWPECPPARGANNLSIAIYQIRAWFKDEADTRTLGICVQQGLYCLDPEGSSWVDVEEFETRLAEARTALQTRNKDRAREHFAAAVELYRGDFLESDPYEEWTVEPRQAYASGCRQAIGWLASDAAELGDWPKVIELAERMLRRDSCDEDGHRWLMTAHWRMGNRAQALHQYQACSKRLEEELGVTPSEETRQLLRTIAGGRSGSLFR